MRVTTGTRDQFPDTLLKWCRRLVAYKWDYNHSRGPGRPCVTQSIGTLVVRMAVVHYE
jgi:hypothetical protein